MTNEALDPLKDHRNRLDAILLVVGIGSDRRSTKDKLVEDDIAKVIQLLRNGAGEAEWAKRPRLFAILYIIGCLDTRLIMDQCVDQGYKDIDLPYGEQMKLPRPLQKSYTMCQAFLRNEHRIFTGIHDLERETSSHHHSSKMPTNSTSKVVNLGRVHTHMSTRFTAYKASRRLQESLSNDREFPEKPKKLATTLEKR